MGGYIWENGKGFDWENAESISGKGEVIELSTRWHAKEALLTGFSFCDFNPLPPQFRTPHR